MVMQDSWAVGKLQGEAMLAWLTAKKGRVEGRVALIKGQPGDSNAAALSSGFLELLLDQPHRLRAGGGALARQLVARRGQDHSREPAAQVRQQDRRLHLQQ